MAENENEYEIYQDESKQWRWRLQAANNEIVSDGDDYESPSATLDGIKRHRRIAATKRVRNVETGEIIEQ